jgi:hypothetical protein
MSGRGKDVCNLRYAQFGLTTTHGLEVTDYYRVLS